MLDKLIKVEERFDDINAKLCESDVVNDMAQYKKLMQELKVLTPIVEKFRQLKAAQETLQEAREMLEAGGLEKDFREMVLEQLEDSKAQAEVIGEELKKLFEFNDKIKEEIRRAGALVAEDAGTVFPECHAFAENSLQ